ncbi:MAG: sulfotransferase [Planctomycetes bacterium]|nr:sulfotransferase [Planctomycetota bacterium]
MTDTIPFIILAAERTGSNLLAGLLDSHPAIVLGGEFFNPTLSEQRRVPWPLVPEAARAELAARRDADPIGFLEQVFEQGRAKGYRAVGFKLMYNHADRLPAVRDFLLSLPELRVVHLTRRNLVERFLSKRRAEVTGRWQKPVDDKGASSAVEKPKLPRIELEFDALVADLLKVERWQATYRSMFAGHPLLEVCYEDLADDPAGRAAPVVGFLGLDTGVELAVRYQKTGTDSLRDAIANYDELKASLARWLSFFPD